MSRSEARIFTSIWDEDDDFIDLSPDAKLLYFALLAQPELDQGAMLPLRERRWSAMLRTPVQLVQASLAELDTTGWACADDVHQEAFVSGYFESERIHKQPRRIVAAREAINAVRSLRLNAVASAELQELFSAFTEPVPRGLRALVLERDCYQCQECGWAPGDPVPFKAGTRRPVFRMLEIDHIWPKSLGGSDDPENLQVLCTTCNCRKGARVLAADETRLSQNDGGWR